MFLNLVLILLAVISLLVLYLRHTKKFWLSQGIPYFNFEREMLTGKYVREKHWVDLFNKSYHMYRYSRVPFVGMFMLFKPLVTIIDLDLIQSILVKDFSKFTDRGLYSNVADEPLMGNLTVMDGEPWKKLRSKLTPTFSTVKMKQIFRSVLETGELMSSVVADMVESTSELDIQNLTACYTTDAIAALTVGHQCNSSRQPDNEFRRIVIKCFAEYRLMKDLLQQRFPKLARWLHCINISKEVTRFFVRLVDDAIRYREANQEKRQDFLQLLMEQRNEMDEPFTLEEIAAQVFSFVMAGFETSSSAISFCLYELSLNPDVQERLRQEILQVLDDHNGELTYESIKEMEYLEQVFKETLRKHPPVPGLKRVCSVDYDVEGGNYRIPANTTIFIPTEAIQNDSRYFPNPSQFDPSRFQVDEQKLRHPMSYLPFGAGPRICIGMKTSYLVTHIGIIKLLQRYRFSITEQTPIPMMYDNTIIVREPLHLFLKVEKI